jgi:predicted nucleotide-binding protein
MDKAFFALKEVVKGKLDDNGYMVTLEKEIQSGYQYKLSTGTIICVYSTGTISVQGKSDKNIQLLFGLLN